MATRGADGLGWLFTFLVGGLAIADSTKKQTAIITLQSSVGDLTAKNSRQAGAILSLEQANVHLRKTLSGVQLDAQRMETEKNRQISQLAKENTELAEKIVKLEAELEKIRTAPKKTA